MAKMMVIIAEQNKNYMFRPISASSGFHNFFVEESYINA